jgi:hypothetical protein
VQAVVEFAQRGSEHASVLDEDSDLVTASSIAKAPQKRSMLLSSQHAASSTSSSW